MWRGVPSTVEGHMRPQDYDRLLQMAYPAAVSVQQLAGCIKTS